MSHTDMGIVGATNDTFILFENGVRRNRLVLPGLSNAADRMPSVEQAGKATWRGRSVNIGSPAALAPSGNVPRRGNTRGQYCKPIDSGPSRRPDFQVHR
jgi:hypothetical protein